MSCQKAINSVNRTLFRAIIVVTKKPKVSIYLPPELKTELDEWAVEENRSVSNLVETVLKDAIANRRKKSNAEKET
jgi:hypothetical protein